MILEIGQNLQSTLIYLAWIFLLNSILQVLVSFIHSLVKKPEETRARIEQTLKYEEDDDDKPEEEAVV